MKNSYYSLMVERVEFVLYWDCDGALIKKNQIPVKQ